MRDARYQTWERSCRRISRIRLFVLLAMVGLAPSAALADQRPNIVLIFVDDLGYGELGCQGNCQIPTPHIDALAEHGVRCTSGYVTASYCSPSRAGLVAGRYQTRFGHELNPVGKHNLDPQAGLPLGERTLADHLRSAGYATGLVGKWHLGGTEAYQPQRRGFDEFFGFLHEGHFYVPGPPYQGVLSFLRKRRPAGSDHPLLEGRTYWNGKLGSDEPPYDEDNPLMRGAKPVPEPAYLTDAFTREAVAFIERHQAAPFFLYLSYNAVHSPMQAADRYLERFRHIEDPHRRVFAAMLSNLDDGVGAILKKLRACRLEENTLVFFISDNGGITAELTSSNGPLRGGKGNLYEGGIRVPFLVQWKGRLPAGEVYSPPVSTLDVFATASAAAGIAMPDDRPLDGVNLLDYLAEPSPSVPHNTLYWRMGDRGALRDGPWKLVLQKRRDGTRTAQLFHLEQDIGEQQDLAAAYPETRLKLEAAWDTLNAEMVPPVWAPARR